MSQRCDICGARVAIGWCSSCRASYTAGRLAWCLPTAVAKWAAERARRGARVIAKEARMEALRARAAKLSTDPRS